MRQAGERLRAKQWGSRSVIAAALAFALQIFAWAWSPAMLAAGEALEICTADGLTTITVGGADDVPAGVKTMSCPLCPLVAGLAPPPQAPLVLEAPVRMARQTTYPLPGAQIAAGWFLATRQARAPPVSRA